jgi:hypothetical protein
LSAAAPSPAIAPRGAADAHIYFRFRCIADLAGLAAGAIRSRMTLSSHLADYELPENPSLWYIVSDCDADRARSAA